MNLLGIAVLGEYIAKIFEEVKRRPHFIRRHIIKDGDVRFAAGLSRERARLKSVLESRLRERACPLCGSRDESMVFAPEEIDEKKLDAFAFALHARRRSTCTTGLSLVRTAIFLLLLSPAPRRANWRAYIKMPRIESSEEARFAADTYKRLLAEVVARLPDRAALSTSAQATGLS